jgi:hypothetical protein
LRKPRFTPMDPPCAPSLWSSLLRSSASSPRSRRS